MPDHQEDPSQVLDHENLDVYQLSLDFVGHVGELLVKLPKEYGYMRDQLGRSSSSIVLNIAEGSGRKSKADRSHFFRIATGSAKESAAALDVLFRLKQISFQDGANGKMMVKRVVSMLIGLTNSLSAT